MWSIYHAVLKRGFMDMNIDVRHTESLYKPMATEQIVLLLFLLPKKRLEIRLFKYLFSVQMESLTTFFFSR